MNTFQVSFDWTGSPPRQYYLRDLVRETYQNTQREGVNLTVTTPDSRANFEMNMNRLVGHRSGNFRITGVTVD